MKKQTIKQLEVLDHSQADAFIAVNEDINTMKQSVEDIGNILHNGDMSLRDINFSTLSGSEAYAQLMWKVNPLYNAYYKLINILSEISPIVLMFNPKKILPTIIHNQESKDTDINELKKTEQYQQLEAQNQLTAEEESALSNWLLNPDKPKNVSIEDYETLTVDAKEPFTFEQERQMKGGNSDLAGTPDGLAGPTTALFTLAYYVTIDDAVVLLDPNSSPDEKAVAGLFLLPTPGKFAKPFLKHADDAGGAINTSRKTTKMMPKYGRKLDYVFGKATGSKHNIDRSIAMEKQLNSIGVFDTKDGRKIVQNNLTNAFNDPKSVLKVQSNGRYVRESILNGPNGVVKLESIWDGDRLITVKIFGGK